MNILEGILYSREYTAYRVMDLFIPGSNSNGHCIFFIHGGGWNGGKRSDWHDTAEYFCMKGFVCAAADYRLVPEWRFPSQIQDIRLAMSFLKSNAVRYGFSSGAIAVAGSSAGGHLAALLSTIDEDDSLGYCDEMEIRDTKPNAAMCFCPITKVCTWDNCSEGIIKMMYNFIGSTENEAPDLYRQASPIEQIKGNEPPFLFIHEDKDDTIPLWHSVTMHEKLLEKNISSRLEILPGVNHGFGYGVKTEAQKASIKYMSDFMKKVENTMNKYDF